MPDILDKYCKPVVRKLTELLTKPLTKLLGFFFFSSSSDTGNGLGTGLTPKVEDLTSIALFAPKGVIGENFGGVDLYPP